MTATPQPIDRSQARAWYREPYVWLLITFPTLAVVGGVAMIVIAVVSDDGLVVDDYYKRGKQINRVLARDRAAATLQLGAELFIDPQSIVRVRLYAGGDASLPERVGLSLAFATRAGIDQTVALYRAGASGYYAGELLRPLIEGRWYVQLQTEHWRLVGALQAPLRGPLQLHVKP
ncbi:MAG: FixH family protein [Gammaproteobacteria bacterium]|nr:FixH family protein [Gammaproteobacteria bacterium]